MYLLCFAACGMARTVSKFPAIPQTVISEAQTPINILMADFISSMSYMHSNNVTLLEFTQKLLRFMIFS